MSTLPADNRAGRFRALPWREFCWAALGLGFLALGLLNMRPPGQLPTTGARLPAQTTQAEPVATDLFDLGFLGRLEQDPLEELKAPRAGWLQTILAEPGQRVAAGDPLLRMWNEAPPGEGRLPEKLTQALSAVEKAEREKATAKNALQKSARRLQELRQQSEESRRTLADAREALEAALRNTIQSAETTAAAKAAQTRRVKAWQRQRDEAVTAVEAARRVVDERSQEADRGKARLRLAEQQEQKAGEEVAKRQRLFDLGVIPQVELSAAKSAQSEAKASLERSRSSVAEAGRSLEAAKASLKGAEAELKGIGAPPPEAPVAPAVDVAKFERQIGAAKEGVAAFQEQLDAALKHSEELRAALQRAEQALEGANETWRKAQVQEATPSADLFTTVHAPADLTVVDILGSERSRVAAGDTLLTYRAGDGWQLAFSAPATYQAHVTLGQACRAKLLVNDYPVVWARLTQIGAPESGQILLAAQLAQPAPEAEPCDALICVERPGTSPPAFEVGEESAQGTEERPPAPVRRRPDD